MKSISIFIWQGTNVLRLLSRNTAEFPKWEISKKFKKKIKKNRQASTDPIFKDKNLLCSEGEVYLLDYDLTYTEIRNTQECFPSGETFWETFIRIFSTKGSAKLGVYPYQLQEQEKSNSSLKVNKAEP